MLRKRKKLATLLLTPIILGVAGFFLAGCAGFRSIWRDTLNTNWQDETAPEIQSAGTSLSKDDGRGQPAKAAHYTLLLFFLPD